MANDTLSRVLAALVASLVAAHVMGALFQRFRQPRAIGEIAGGLLLGPTVLGAVSPGAERWLFAKTGAPGEVFGAVAQLGLLLLMFCSGTELRKAVDRAQGRLVGMVAGIGIVLPFLAGVAVLQVTGLRQYWGPAGNYGSFLLVFATAIAVTSIPVISRIMHDLGILRTPFARVVLGVAVVEDVVLYVVLAIAISLASSTVAPAFGLSAELHLESGSIPDIAYHVVMTLAVLAGFLGVARWRSTRPALRNSAASALMNSGPASRRILVVLATALLCLFLGVETFLGAFAAGIAAGARQEPAGATGEYSARDSRHALPDFSYAFFIPVYFASVGVSLDLRHGFDVVFFVVFLAFACVVKAFSVYLGARVGGMASKRAVNLAVALNARGGPGIVLASVSFNAHVVNEGFYACLLLLSILTSLGAGSWLERVPKHVFADEPTAREEPEPVDDVARLIPSGKPDPMAG